MTVGENTSEEINKNKVEKQILCFREYDRTLGKEEMQARGKRNWIRGEKSLGEKRLSDILKEEKGEGEIKRTEGTEQKTDKINKRRNNKERK